MKKLGKGRAEAITKEDIARLADELACHPAELEAIDIVESSGFGWFKDGRIKILNEKHWLYKLTSGKIRAKCVAAGVARKRWISPKQGGYKDQSTAGARYDILQRGIAIAGDKAVEAISMGRYQIMGFNYKICGFSSAGAMFKAFCDSEANQLRAFGNFLRGKGLAKVLTKGLARPLTLAEFRQVENVYNGGGLNGAYAKRMQREAAILRAGKWRHFKPGQSGLPADMRKVEPVPRPKPESTAPGRAGAAVAAMIVAVAGAIGGFIWFKVLRRKKTK